MKLHMNNLHCSYTGPVVIDEEWQIMPICEMLSIFESFKSYDFPLYFMVDLEPHMWMKVQFILSDCGVNESISPQIGLSQEWCYIFWYHWHLDVKKLPGYFGVIFYQKHLREHMVCMSKEVYVAVFDYNFERAKAILANNPAHLIYLCEFHDHPEQFAEYKINEVEVSMMRSGSQFYEANHASIVAQLGRGFFSWCIFRL